MLVTDGVKYLKDTGLYVGNVERQCSDELGVAGVEGTMFGFDGGYGKVFNEFGEGLQGFGEGAKQCITFFGCFAYRCCFDELGEQVALRGGGGGGGGVHRIVAQTV